MILDFVCCTYGCKLLNLISVTETQDGVACCQNTTRYIEFPRAHHLNFVCTFKCLDCYHSYDFTPPKGASFDTILMLFDDVGFGVRARFK